MFSQYERDHLRQLGLNLLRLPWPKEGAQVRLTRPQGQYNAATVDRPDASSSSKPWTDTPPHSDGSVKILQGPTGVNATRHLGARNSSAKNALSKYILNVGLTVGPDAHRPHTTPVIFDTEAGPNIIKLVTVPNRVYITDLEDPFELNKPLIAS